MSDQPWQLPLVFQLPWPLDVLQLTEGSGFWDWDIQGGRLLRSTGWLVLYGREPVPADEPFDILEWVSWLHPDDRGPCDVALKKLFASDEMIWRQRFRVIWPDGTVRILRSVGAVERDESGTPIRMIGLDRDITEEVHNRTALAASEERYQLAVDAAREAIFDWDLESDRLHLTSRASDLYGFESESGGHLFDELALRTPEEARRVRSAVDEHLHGGEHLDVTHRYVHPDGAQLWLRMRGEALRDSRGHAIRLVGAIADVTDEFRQREMWRLTETTARVGGWEVDASSHLSYWSPGVYNLFERPIEQGVPELEDAIAYYDEEDGSRAKIVAAVDAALNQGRAFDFDLNCTTDRGNRLRVHVNGRAELEHGRIQRIYGSIQDVTQRRDLEEQLVHAQKLESVGRLAGGIAHHFNNLLTVITAAADLAETDDPDALHEIEMIQGAARRGAELTRQLLTFARREEPNAEVFSLSRQLTGLSDLLRKAVGESIDLQLDIPIHPVPIVTDSGRFEQVVMNLAVNARDAMPDGGQLKITLDVIDLPDSERIRDLADGRYARLVVEDTGVGVPEELRARVFEPFFTTKPVGTGSGLGLATCYGILRSAKGTIELDAVEPSGSRFTVLLPMADEGDLMPDTVVAPRPMKAVRGRRFLVVEDEDSVREIMSRTLGLEDNEILQADGPRSAIDLALRMDEPPDALVSDVRMPGGTGLDLAVRLRSRWPELRVLLVSGYNEEVDPNRIQDEQTRFLAKPFRPNELIEAVSELLQD